MGRVIGADRRRTAPVPAALLVAGAALLMASAAIHLQLWANGYRSITTIGPLFFAQGAFGILISLLVALVRRVFVAFVGALYALATVIGLLFASHGGLFGYQTTMSVPWAKTSLIVELAAVALLCTGGGLAVMTERAHVQRWRSLKSARR
jgi:hypothetical protein